MNIRTIAVSIGIGLLINLAACEKKEEPVPPPPPPPPEVMPEAPLQSPHSASKSVTKTIVPDSVKGAWRAVKLKVTNKETKESEVITINLGDDYSLPGSDIKISVGDFLPAFSMDRFTVTSRSNEPDNPAVNVTVYEGGNKLYGGWLFSQHPAYRPFKHEKYGLTLVEGIRK